MFISFEVSLDEVTVLNCLKTFSSSFMADDNSLPFTPRGFM